MDDNEQKEESSVELSDKNWNRVIEAAAKAGYREGVEEGKQSVFQEGFDVGYEDAFKTAFILGKYKGLAISLPNDLQIPSPVNDILEKTRRGACYVCAEKSKTSKDPAADDSDLKPLQELRNAQKIHSDKTIETLYEYFEILFRERGTSIDNFSL